MNKYDPDIHHRRSIRLRGYDYSHEGLYFITICTQNRECLFGKIVGGEMMLNEYGKIVNNVWNGLSKHYANIELPHYITMPNHIHGIIAITGAITVFTDIAGGVGVGGVGGVGAGFKPAPTGTPSAPTGTSPVQKQHGLSEIVRAFKTFSARQINEMRNLTGVSVWQRNYYEHIIRNEESYYAISEYIMNNPAKWENDKFYENR